MAENFFNQTEGSGKKLHTYNRTIGANDVHDEVVTLGEQYLDSYVLSVGVNPVSTATVDSHLLQLMAGSSLKLRIRRIELYQHSMATTAGMMALALFRVTSAGTGGTSRTPQPLLQGGTASGATGMTLPTAKGTEGAQPIHVATCYLMQTVGASTPLENPRFIWEADARTPPIVVSAGTANGLVIKNLSAIAGAAVYISIWFDESSF